ncbi:hypothetical protein ABID56_000391 [Alkalibacillus flavidus]|uniref:MBL fold metallo-hydrolase n=1 Tax=Alkalibacillus flavidus TaxID=546021 RepID=A0ABV2KRV3_9BACI
MNVWIVMLWLIGSVTSSPISEEPWLFTPTSAGDTVLLQDDQETILINTGKRDQYEAIERLMKINDVSPIKSIVMTSSEANSCSNVRRLTERHPIKHIYMTETMASSCANQLNDSINQLTLNEDVHFALNRDMFFHYHPVDPSKGNMIVSNNQTSVYWFESEQSPILEDIDILYTPSYVKHDDMDEAVIDKLNPQLAIINQDVDHYDSSIHQLLQTLWIDTYLLKQNLAIHIFNDVDDFSIRLEKLPKND